MNLRKANQIRRFKLNPYHIARAAALWREGLGSFEIADIMGLNEAHIWNNMDKVKGRT